MHLAACFAGHEAGGVRLASSLAAAGETDAALLDLGAQLRKLGFEPCDPVGDAGRFAIALLALQHRRQLLAGGRSANTASHLYSVMNTFLDWCHEDGIIEDEPHRHWRGPGRSAPDPRGLSREALVNLLRQLVTLREHDDWQELRNETLIWFMVTVGARRAEAAVLNWAKTDLLAGTVKLRGKGDKERLIPLLGPVRRRLERLQQLEVTTGAVFAADPRTGRALQPESVNSIFKRWIVARIGLAVTPHDLRHSFAQLLRSAGAELDELQDLLGHARFETTRLYYGKTPIEQLREAVERHPLRELLEELEGLEEPKQEGGENNTSGTVDWSI